MINSCAWVDGYGVKCGRACVEQFCVRHDKLDCANCKCIKATHECNYDVGMVCGFPLCQGCEHDPTSGKHTVKTLVKVGAGAWSNQTKPIILNIDIDVENMRAEILRKQGELDDLTRDTFAILQSEIRRIRYVVSRLVCEYQFGNTTNAPCRCQICQVKESCFGSNK